MKTLIIVRHGHHYSFDENLSNHGKEQMESLAPKIEPFIKKTTAILLTSTAPRALQSAELLGEKLNLKPICKPILWADAVNPEKDFNELFNLINQLQENVVIIITHLGYTNFFPGFFLKKKLNQTTTHIYTKLDEGKAIVVNPETQNYYYLS